MRTLVIGISLSAILLLPSLAGAQGLPPAEGAPKVLRDPLGFIQDKLGIHLDRIIPGFTGEMMTPEQVTSGAPHVWENIKGWIQEHLGVDVEHFLRGIIDLLIWIFEFAIKLFTSVLDLLH